MIEKLIKNGKRYQERVWPEKFILWIRYMPLAYIKAIWWYFVKALRWEDVCDDEIGRVEWDTCVGINVGMAQHKMGWYYTFEEVFGEIEELEIKDNIKNGKDLTKGWKV